MIPKVLYKAEEAAQATGICRAKVFQLMKSGELPSVKVGASRRIPVEALARWIEQKLAEAAAE